MRLFCFFCGKPVSNELPDDTTLRAVCVCPECLPHTMREDVPSGLLSPGDDD